MGAFKIRPKFDVVNWKDFETDWGVKILEIKGATDENAKGYYSIAFAEENGAEVYVPNDRKVDTSSVEIRGMFVGIGALGYIEQMKAYLRGNGILHFADENKGIEFDLVYESFTPEVERYRAEGDFVQFKLNFTKNINGVIDSGFLNEYTEANLEKLKADIIAAAGTAYLAAENANEAAQAAYNAIINLDSEGVLAALENKVDKIAGKGLSTEDYTTTEKNKLAGIAPGANNYIHPETHPASIINQDANNRFVTDTEKGIWNGKQDALGFTPENIANKKTSITDSNTDYPTTRAVKTFVEAAVAQKSFYPDTMTVNAGTLLQGTVADLSAVGGTDVIIQEATGANPLTATFAFSGVTEVTAFVFYGEYVGGAMHQVYVEVYNYVSSAWDLKLIIGTEGDKKWYSAPIYNANAYLSSGNMQVRFRHIQNGVASHQLTLDYVEINSGGSGGQTNVSASSVIFTPTGNLSSTNVASALVELDSDVTDLYTKLNTTSLTAGYLPYWDGSKLLNSKLRRLSAAITEFVGGIDNNNTFRITIDNIYSSDFQQNGGQGPFEFGTYVDFNIINVSTGSTFPFANINFVTRDNSSSDIAMRIGGGSQKGWVGIGYLLKQDTERLAVNGDIFANGALKLAAGEVSYGANDSGGTGYRLLRVPNI